MAPLPGAPDGHIERLNAYLTELNISPQAYAANVVSLLKRALPSHSNEVESASPMAMNLVSRAQSLVARTDSTINLGSGAVDPHNINNNALFAVFGLIGAGFVCTGIWFFFWAKNGGIHFKENDWDEYKSTVLRRKGPNGTTLSGATESTDLGGGSIYKDYDNESDTMTTVTRIKEKFKPRRRNSRDRKSEKHGKSRRGKKSSRHSEKTYDEESNIDGVDRIDHALIDEDMDEAHSAIRAYRHERPAKVGGLNREADGSAWDGSNPSHSQASHSQADARSDLLSNREPTPENTPTKSYRKVRDDQYTGGIRKVAPSVSKPSSSFWNRGANNRKRDTSKHDAESIREEAKRLQEKGRAASSRGASSSRAPSTSARPPRRDFSFQTNDYDMSEADITSVRDEERIAREERRLARRERRSRQGGSRSPEKRHHVPALPGTYEESEVGSELGTKSYPCYIAGLSSGAPTLAASSVTGASSVAGGSEYADERRKRRERANGGHRKKRRDSLSESD